MDFQLVSKNSVGAVATLFLVILLSQARFFNFLIDTALGRAILILFILGISYTNKILGVVAVLFIIIAFNNSDIGYLEGFTSSPNTDEKKVEENKVEETPKDKGIEGSNISEREHTMLRGKRSSEVPVYPNARNQDDTVEPTDTSIFADNYSSV
jgi:hypothetical protein